ncbi:hypothetical protein ACFX12_036234 [Malus domestica]
MATPRCMVQVISKDRHPMARCMILQTLSTTEVRCIALDYSSSSSKIKFVEGSTSGSTGPSPLPRFAVSRSAPISYK